MDEDEAIVWAVFSAVAAMSSAVATKNMEREEEGDA